MMSLNYQMVLTLCQIFKIVLNIIKKHYTLTKIPPIQVHIKRINNRFVFKIKDGYKLKLQTTGATKLLGSTKKQ